MSDYGPSAGMPPTDDPPNPDCQCFNPMAAMVCPTGHMLECHYPLSCEEAECDHYLIQTQGEYEANDVL